MITAHPLLFSVLPQEKSKVDLEAQEKYSEPREVEVILFHDIQ